MIAFPPLADTIKEIGPNFLLTIMS